MQPAARLGPRRLHCGDVGGAYHPVAVKPAFSQHREHRIGCRVDMAGNSRHALARRLVLDVLCRLRLTGRVSGGARLAIRPIRGGAVRSISVLISARVLRNFAGVVLRIFLV
jgi:hypothetical protein